VPFIGIAIQGNTSSFWQYVIAGMGKYDAENPGACKAKVVFANDDQQTQISQVETLIQQGIDVLILNFVDPEACKPVLDACADADIPILICTDDLGTDYQQYRMAFVGSNHVAAGEQQIERVVTTCGENAKIAIIDAPIGHSAQIGRAQGYENGLAKYPNIEVVARDSADWSSDKALALVNNWLAAGKEFDYIVCQSDAKMMGVIQALAENDMTGKILTSGIDGTVDALAAVEAGTADMSLYHPGEDHGYKILELAIKVANGETVDGFNYSPYAEATADTIDDIMMLQNARVELVSKYFNTFGQ
jgi:ABC-type sugar transport system substrate-binding protein